MQKEELKLQNLTEIRKELTRFMMIYKFGLDEMNTKIKILKEEFQYIHDYNPIEHIKSRIKTPESILNKLKRKNLELTLESIEKNIHDIAGIRIVCSFVSDIYKISDMIQKQKDVTVVTCKDYIQNPKPNGYQSLHLIIKIPVFLSDQVKDVFVEIQIRTVAMDFWASLEHKIFYRYHKDVPEYIMKELRYSATVATELDNRMEKLHHEIEEVMKNEQTSNDQLLLTEHHKGLDLLPTALLETLISKEDK